MILDGKLSPKERRARAIEVLTQVGMKERLNHYPSQLSGGEQQRVSTEPAIFESSENKIKQDFGDVGHYCKGRVKQTRCTFAGRAYVSLHSSPPSPSWHCGQHPTRMEHSLSLSFMPTEEIWTL